METGVFSDETGVFSDETGVFSDETGVFSDETGVFSDETGVFSDETDVFSNVAGIFSNVTFGTAGTGSTDPRMRSTGRRMLRPKTISHGETPSDSCSAERYADMRREEEDNGFLFNWSIGALVQAKTLRFLVEVCLLEPLEDFF